MDYHERNLVIDKGVNEIKKPKDYCEISFCKVCDEELYKHEYSINGMHQHCYMEQMVKKSLRIPQD